MHKVKIRMCLFDLPHVKYRGDKPRGFTVLPARPKTGRAVAGEFDSPRPSRDGLAGIHTRTPDTSVRVVGSTPPDNTRLTYCSRVSRGVAFPRNCRQLLRIKVFNPRRNCIPQYDRIHHIAYSIHPRGQVVRESELSRHHGRPKVFRTTPRHSRCISVDQRLRARDRSPQGTQNKQVNL
jgi:hypothetical protein